MAVTVDPTTVDAVRRAADQARDAIAGGNSDADDDIHTALNVALEALGLAKVPWS